MKYLSLFLFMILLSCSSQPKPDQNTYQTDKAAILKVMHNQEMAWNSRDLEGFMNGY